MNGAASTSALPNWLVQALAGALLLVLGGGVGGGVTARLEEETRNQSDQGVTVLAEQVAYWYDRAIACEEGTP